MAGAITFAIRLSFIIVIGKREIPEFFKRAMRFIPPAVLTAIIFPELLQHSGRLELTISNDRLISGLAAAVIAWKTKNAILTIVGGLVLLWILQLI